MVVGAGVASDNVVGLLDSDRMANALNVVVITGGVIVLLQLCFLVTVIHSSLSSNVPAHRQSLSASSFSA